MFFFYLHLGLLPASSNWRTAGSACLKRRSAHWIETARKTVFQSTDRSHLQKNLCYNISTYVKSVLIKYANCLLIFFYNKNLFLALNDCASDRICKKLIKIIYKKGLYIILLNKKMIDPNYLHI